MWPFKKKPEEKKIDAAWLKEHPNCVHANVLLNPHSEVQEAFVAQLVENRKAYIEKIFAEHKEMRKTSPEVADMMLQINLMMLF